MCKTIEKRNYEILLVPSIQENIKRETTDHEPTIKITAQLVKSEAFDYGNGTATVLQFTNYARPFETERLLDTRYEHGIVSDFDKWCRDYFKSCYGDYLAEVNEVTER